MTTLVQQIASSGVKGVAVVHSAEDGLVPYDQGREYVTAQRPAGMPVDMYTVLRRTSDTNQTGQTTLLSDANGSSDCTGGGSGAVGPLPSVVPVCDPFAGHGWEGSETQLTIRTGMALAWNFISKHPQGPANRECAVDAGAVNPLGTTCAPTAGPPAVAPVAARAATASAEIHASGRAATPHPASAPSNGRATAPAATTRASRPASEPGFIATLAAAVVRLAQTVAGALSA